MHEIGILLLEDANIPNSHQRNVTSMYSDGEAVRDMKEEHFGSDIQLSLTYNCSWDWNFARKL